MALRCVAAVVAIAALGLASSVPRPEDLSRDTPGWPCPIPAMIAPCTCSQDTEYNLYMDCSLANSEEQLERIFSSTFPFKDFYELRINHDPADADNVIDMITADTFADLSFERIIITGTRLQEIIDEAFADSHETLRFLDLSGNILQAFTFESLALYTSLHTLILDDNQFPDLYNLESQSLVIFSANRNHNMKMDSTNPFQGAPALEELYLSEIGLTTLRTNLFNTLTKLKVVDFSKNHLVRLEQDTINVVGYTLEHVNFDDNEIFNISHDAFTGFKEDATLSMVANNIVKLHETDWSHIFQQITFRETIDLKGNLLLCGCEIDWLFMKHEEEYLCRLTDTTRCDGSGNQQVIFLDVNIICDQCADVMLDCPPQTYCEIPGTISYQ